jgi:hypothetical protein
MAKVQQFGIKSKYLAKEIMKNIQIQFGEQVDRKSGNIFQKQFQATITVTKGSESPCIPNICLILKLGNDKLFLATDDMEQMELAIYQLSKFIITNKSICNVAVTKARKEYWAHHEALKQKTENNGDINGISSRVTSESYPVPQKPQNSNEISPDSSFDIKHTINTV